MMLITGEYVYIYVIDLKKQLHVFHLIDIYFAEILVF